MESAQSTDVATNGSDDDEDAIQPRTSKGKTINYI